MKAKALIAVGAIMLAITIIGCSNQNAVAPVTNNSVPNNASIVPDPGTLRGEFYSDQYGCYNMKVGKDRYVELNFNFNVPSDISDGTLVQIFGHFDMQPGGHCGLEESFTVNRLTVLTGNRVIGDEGVPFEN